MYYLQSRKEARMKTVGLLTGMILFLLFTYWVSTQIEGRACQYYDPTVNRVKEAVCYE